MSAGGGDGFPTNPSITAPSRLSKYFVDVNPLEGHAGERFGRVVCESVLITDLINKGTVKNTVDNPRFNM